jgi:HIRAN domain
MASIRDFDSRRSGSSPGKPTKRNSSVLGVHVGLKNRRYSFNSNLFHRFNKKESINFKKEKVMKKEHLAHFTIAGFTYYDGALAFSKLKIGTKLELKPEENNPFDARAVALYYKDYKLGFVPRSENRIIYKLLKIGMVNNLRAVIQQLDSREHPEKQVMVVIHLLNDDSAAKH